MLCGTESLQFVCIEAGGNQGAVPCRMVTLFFNFIPEIKSVSLGDGDASLHVAHCLNSWYVCVICTVSLLVVIRIQLMSATWLARRTSVYIPVDANDCCGTSMVHKVVV